MRFVVALANLSAASAFLHIQGKQSDQQCLANDQKMRELLQNKLAGACEDICKATGAYPQCSGCSNFVMPDSTPGVMTWDEMFTRMDDLVDWGRDQLKQMRKMQAMALPQINGTAAASAAPPIVKPHGPDVTTVPAQVKTVTPPSAPVIKR